MVWNWLQRHPRLVDIGIALALASGYVGRAAHFGRWTIGLPVTPSLSILRIHHPGRTDTDVIA
jgi:hypothetical protein